MTKLAMTIIVLMLIALIFVYKKCFGGIPSAKSFLVMVCLALMPLCLQYGVLEVVDNVLPGSFGPALLVDVLQLSLILMIFGVGAKILPISLPLYFWIPIAVVILSFVNPANSNPLAALVPLQIFVTGWFFGALVNKNLSHEELAKVLNVAMFSSIGLQAILATCYPVLGMTQVLEITNNGALEWATRGGTRSPSACGTFSHPGVLGLFATITLSFFISQHRRLELKKLSLLGIGLSCYALVLSQSRTSMLTAGIVGIATWWLSRGYTAHRQRSNALLLFVMMATVAIVMIWLKGQVEHSDILGQMQNRGAHFSMALESFRNHPIAGLGVNNHLSAFGNQNFKSVDPVSESFFYENPIHNVHLIVLVETGLIGGFAWIFGLLAVMLKSARKSMQSNAGFAHANLVGLVSTVTLYGMTGWAPFSRGIAPYLIVMFSIYYLAAPRGDIGDAP